MSAFLVVLAVVGGMLVARPADHTPQANPFVRKHHAPAPYQERRGDVSIEYR